MCSVVITSRCPRTCFPIHTPIVAFPDSNSFIWARRMEMRPLALPRSITSANFGCLLRLAMVFGDTQNQAAISSSVHCSEQSFSSSAKSILTGLRPACSRNPPIINNPRPADMNLRQTQAFRRVRSALAYRTRAFTVNIREARRKWKPFSNRLFTRRREPDGLTGLTAFLQKLPYARVVK